MVPAGCPGDIVVVVILARHLGGVVVVMLPAAHRLNVVVEACGLGNGCACMVSGAWVYGLSEVKGGYCSAGAGWHMNQKKTNTRGRVGSGVVCATIQGSTGHGELYTANRQPAYAQSPVSAARTSVLQELAQAQAHAYAQAHVQLGTHVQAQL